MTILLEERQRLYLNNSSRRTVCVCVCEEEERDKEKKSICLSWHSGYTDLEKKQNYIVAILMLSSSSFSHLPSCHYSIYEIEYSYALIS